MENARPPRSAQAVGFVLTALALIAFVVNVDAAGYGLTAIAFGVAALNASTGLCLGCTDRMAPTIPTGSSGARSRRPSASSPLHGSHADDPDAFVSTFTFLERDGVTELTLRSLLRTRAIRDHVSSPSGVTHLTFTRASG